MTVFRYAPQLIERFPTVHGAVVLGRGLRNGPAPPGLAEAYAAEQAAVLARIGDAPLSDIPSLAAWRRVFSAFGVKPTQYRSAAEALLRRLTKHGSIPAIGSLVDLGNLVAIRHALPVAVFDQRPVTGTTTVRFATGEERFTDLGSDVTVHPEPGEVLFVDEAGLVSARRWCWRQSAQSAAGPDTTDALVTIEAHHDGGAETVANAVEDLTALLAEYQPGATIRSALLSADGPEFP